MFEAFATQEELDAVSVESAEAHAFTLPASASDAEKRAAAAQLAKINLGKYENGIIDPNASDDFDGSVIWNNRNPFASGDEYLEKMKAVRLAGDQADTPEWKEWAAAGSDRSKLLAIARREQEFKSKVGEGFSNALTYSANMADAYFVNAPEEILEARNFINKWETLYRHNEPSQRRPVPNAFNPRMVPIEETEKWFKDQFGQSYADIESQVEPARQKLAAWKTQRDEDAVITEYRTRVEANNLHRKYQALQDVLAPESVKMIDRSIRSGALSGSDVELFKSLPDKDKPVVAGFIRNARLRRDNSVLYDAGYALLDSAARLGVNAGRAVGRMVAAPFADREELNRYYMNRALIEQATGYDPAQDHGGAGRAFIGLASTLPHMAATAIPYVGPAISALAASQQIADQIAAQGGDVTSLDAQAFILGAGVAYMAVERVQWNKFIGKEITDLEMRLIYANIGKTLAKNFTKIGAHSIQEIGKETLEEMVQGAIEEGAVAFGLGQDVARAAATGFIEDFDSIGTMAMLAGVGIGAKAARFRYNARFSNADVAETSIRLLQAETIAGDLVKAPVDTPESRESLNTLRKNWFAAWKQGDNQAAVDYFAGLGFDADQSAKLTGAFEAEYLFHTQQGVEQSKYANWVLSPAEMLGQALGSDAIITPLDTHSFQVESRINGKLGRFTVFTNADPETDMNTPGYAASVEQATADPESVKNGWKPITADEWLAMSPQERTEATETRNLKNNGWFKITTEGGASLDANQAKALLTGEIHLTQSGVAKNTVFHEYAHAALSLMRSAGALTDADVAALEKHFGKGKIASETFNEEAFSEAYRAYATHRLEVKKDVDGIFARIVAFLEKLLRLGDGAKNMHTARADVRSFISSLDAAEAAKPASVEGGRGKVEGEAKPAETAPAPEAQPQSPEAAPAPVEAVASSSSPEVGGRRSAVEPESTAQPEPSPSTFHPQPSTGGNAATPRRSGDFGLAALLESSPVIQHIHGNIGRMMNRAQYIKSKGKQWIKEHPGALALYDGAPGGGLGVAARAVYGGTLAPDVVAQQLYDAGLIADPYMDTMWQAIAGEVDTYRKEKESEKDRRETEIAAQRGHDRFEKAAVKPDKTHARLNPVPLRAENLEEGDTLTVCVKTKEGARAERLTVESTDPLTLSASDTFGPPLELYGAETLNVSGFNELDASRHHLTAEAANAELESIRKEYTNPDGAMKPGWMKAPNGQPTKLTERQWLQTRTPSFKQWFGDWEATFPLVMRSEGFKDIRPLFEELIGKAFTNRATGHSAVLTGGTLKEMLNPNETQKSVAHYTGLDAFKDGSLTESQAKNKMFRAHIAAAENIISLFERAEFGFSEEGTKRGVKTMHRFYAPFRHDGETFIAKISVKEFLDSNIDNHLYSIQSLKIEKPGVNSGLAGQDQIEPNAPALNADGIHATITKGQKLDVSVENKIAQLLESVNPSEVSKIVDENGEPKVFYHGSPDARFVDENGTFQTVAQRAAGFMDDEGRAKAEADAAYFFTDDFKTAKTYAIAERAFDYQNAEPAVLSVFLNIRNPLKVDAGGERWQGRNMSKLHPAAEAKKQGRDGIAVENVIDPYTTKGSKKSMVLLAFLPNQIKSAIDNIGTFDNTNTHIRHHLAVGDALDTHEKAEALRKAIVYQPIADGVLLDRRVSPMKAAQFFLDHIVGKTFTTPEGKTFTANSGHFFRFVCEGAPDGSGKGYIKEASSGEEAFRLIAGGKVESLDGYQHDRAMMLPLLPQIIEDPAAILSEKNTRPLKQLHVFGYTTGHGNTVIVSFRDIGGENIGPVTLHRNRLGNTLLQKYSLVYLKADEATGAVTGNPAAGAWSDKENAGSHTSSNTRKIPHSGEDVNRALMVSGILEKLAYDPEFFNRFGDPEMDSPGQLRETARVILEETAAEGKLAETLAGYGFSPDYIEALGVDTGRYHVTAEAQRYRPESWLTASVAAEILAEGVDPSPNLVKKRAEKIGAAGVDVTKLIDRAREMAEQHKSQALETALGGQSMTQLIGQMAGKIDYEAIGKRLVVQGAAAERDLADRSAVEMERARARLLKSQVNRAEGSDYREMQIQTGANLSETLLNILPKEKPGAARAPDTQPADELNASLTPEHEAELLKINAGRRQNLTDLLNALYTTRDRRQKEADAQREKDATAQAEKDAKAAPDADLADGAEITVEAEGLPAITPAMLAQFKVDFSNPEEVALFIRLWSERHLLATSKHRSAKALWQDPVQRRRYRETVRTMLNELADALMEADNSRVAIQRAIDEIESDRPDTIERNCSYVLGLINKHAIRQTRAELIKTFRETLKTAAIQGEEFDALGEDLKRKVTAHTEEQARYLRRIVLWSRAQVEEEMDELVKFIDSQTLYVETSKKETGREIKLADDRQIFEAQQRLKLLEVCGGLKNAMPADIKAVSESVVSWLVNEQIVHHANWLKHQEVIKKHGGFFRAGIRRDGNYAKHVDSRLEGWRDSLIGMMGIRLGELIRFSTGETNQKAKLALDEIEYILQSGGNEYAMTKLNGQRMMGECIARAYGSHKKGLARLEEKLDPAVVKQIYRQGLYGWGQRQDAAKMEAQSEIQPENNVTIAHALQLLGQLEQNFYAENVRTHDRLDHARMLRAALEPEDLAFLNEVRAYYAAQREIISAVVKRVTGLPVMSPDPLYIPARMKMEEDNSLAGVHRQWSPLAASLTPRRKNRRDFDESVTILDAWHGSLEDAALAVGYGARGLDLRALLCNAATKEAVRHFHGDNKANRLYQHLDQILRQAPEMRKSDPANHALHTARKWISYFALSGNMLSALKQGASVPVWANIIGFKKLWQHMADIGSKEAQQAIKELNQHTGHHVRYGMGWSAEVAETLRDPALSWVEKGYKLGMAPNQFMDYVPGIWIAQGVYRDLTATYLDRGMNEAEAKERAATMTWKLVEQTQQSGRVENLTSAYRNGGDLARLFFQFSTSPLQQLQYELSAFRDWRDGVEGGRAKLTRAVVINHVLVPGFMLLATKFWKTLLGDDDDPLEAWKITLAAFMGQFGSIIFLGSMTETALSTLLSGKRPRSGGGSLIPAEGVFRIGGAFALTAHDLAFMETEKLKKDLLSILTQTVAPARHVLQATENWLGDDPKKKK